jgi:hypothetical protein
VGYPVRCTIPDAVKTQPNNPLLLLAAVILFFALLWSCAGCAAWRGDYTGFVKPPFRPEAPAREAPDAYDPSPAAAEFEALLTGTRLGDDFRDFYTRVPKPDVTVVSATAASDDVRQVTFRYGWNTQPRYATVWYDADTGRITLIHRADAAGGVYIPE